MDDFTQGVGKTIAKAEIVGNSLQLISSAAGIQGLVKQGAPPREVTEVPTGDEPESAA